MNMKKVNLFLLLIILSPCLLFMSACGTQPVKFSIRFMVGETPYAIVETRGNETIQMPEDPIKEGYTFDGWYCDNNVWQQPFTANSLVHTLLSSDMKVYAKFSLTHSHILVKVERKEPTCTETGYEEYFKCECGKLFSDENGNNEISAIKTIATTGHAFGEWYEVKPASYTEEGQDRRDCSKCDYYETRKVDKLFANVIEPTSLTIEYGILKWNGLSPFGFDVVVNGVSKTIYDNSYETSLKSDDYNSVKVACIYENGTKSNYVELDDFVVNEPITNLHFIDDGNNVTFTWDSPSNLYSYIFMYNNVEKNIVGTQHFYSVPRNQLQKGTEISIYIDGLSSANFYPSKKCTILLGQLDAPSLQINKLNVEWNEVTNANKYKVQALTTLTQTATSYSYDGADGGNYSITVTALGADFLNNSATLTFIKLKQPNIDIKENLVSWNAIAGQVRYAVLIDDVETKFIGNTYTIQNTNPEYDIYLYASPVQSNTMQSDRVIISKFCYMQYSTVYWGTVVADYPKYLKVVDTVTLCVPIKLLSFNFSNLNHNVILIASSVPKTIDKNYITEIIVPDGTTSISQNAFKGCTKATNITIPDSVTTIENFAFSGCSNLTSINIPDSVTNIGWAFSGCNSLSIVHIASLESWFNIDFKDSSSNPLYYAHHLYLNGEELTEITIPDTVTKIKKYALQGASSISSIKIPDTVTSIGSFAFSECKNLSSITIPKSVTSIGECTLKACLSLVEITIPFVGSSILGFNHLGYLFGTSDYSNNATYVPSSLKKVIISGGASIEACAFYNCRNLTSIIIPNSVIRIGDKAFAGCSSLTSIFIPSSVTSIGYAAFSGCNGLISIDVEKENKKYHSVGNCIIDTAREILVAGCKCSVIPNDESVTSVGSYAFYNCEGLISIVIPSSVICIESNAFDGCSNLISITLCEGMTNIRDSAFSSCNSLRQINIPNSVTSIGYYVFSGCISLTSIIIPQKVTDIGVRAFDGCSSLMIYCEAVLQPNNWSEYWNMNHIGQVYWYRETQSTESGNYWHYVNGKATKW